MRESDILLGCLAMVYSAFIFFYIYGYNHYSEVIAYGVTSIITALVWLFIFENFNYSDRVIIRWAQNVLYIQ